MKKLLLFVVVVAAGGYAYTEYGPHEPMVDSVVLGSGHEVVIDRAQMVWATMKPRHLHVEYESDAGDAGAVRREALAVAQSLMEEAEAEGAREIVIEASRYVFETDSHETIKVSEKVAVLE